MSRPDARVSARNLCARLVRSGEAQSVLEAAIVIPFLILLVLGVVELGLAIDHSHLVSALSREGSNLISRETELEDAATVLGTIGGSRVDFNSNAVVIFSVLKRGETTNTTNYGKMILYARYTFGTYSASSKLSTRGSGSFGADHVATNSDNDSSLQVSNPPANLIGVNGGMVYVTEVFSRHALITPLREFGVNVPEELYSVAYF